MTRSSSQVLSWRRGWVGHSHEDYNAIGSTAVTFLLSASTVFKVLIKSGILAQPWYMLTPSTLQGSYWKLLSWQKIRLCYLPNSPSDSSFKHMIAFGYTHTSSFQLSLAAGVRKFVLIPVDTSTLILRPLASFVCTLCVHAHRIKTGHAIFCPLPKAYL